MGGQTAFDVYLDRLDADSELLTSIIVEGEIRFGLARPRPKAPVSAPLDWDELDLDLDPTLFNIETMLPRLAKLGDLFQGTLRDQQDLLPAIEAFQKLYLDKHDYHLFGDPALLMR